MGKISEPEPVNLIIGMLSSIPAQFEIAKNELEKCYGKIDFTSEIIPFTFTKYYNHEMGENINRKFLSFSTLINPKDIATIKVHTNNLETTLTTNNTNITRAINLDPGYICNSKLILASTKDFAHRIYLQQGIFAEITLTYSSRNKSYEPHDLTFPDYKSDKYIKFFNDVKLLYKEKLKTFIED